MSRSLLLWRGLCLFSLACFLVTPPALAAGSASVAMRGRVPVLCDLRVHTSGQTTNWDLSHNRIDVVWVSVRETCNDPDGYRVMVSSVGNGSLSALDSLEGERLPYQLSYDNVLADLASSSSSPVSVTHAFTGTGRGGIDRAVKISMKSGRGGAYTDTLIFTIVHN